MRTESFRIGNLIKGRLSTHRINKIDKASVYSEDVRANENSIHPEENSQINSVKPIPFNDALVARLGLEFGPDGFCTLYENNGQKVMLGDGNSLHIQGDPKSVKDQSYKIDVDYLHDFQNLFFTLTGEEFIIQTSVVESLHTLK